MPSYDSLQIQIDLFKTKVNALSGATLNTQDLVFLAKAIESMGNLLGVNDVLAATAEKINEIQTASSGAVTQIGTAGGTQVSNVQSAGLAAVASVNAVLSNFTVYSHMGVI